MKTFMVAGMNRIGRVKKTTSQPFSDSNTCTCQICGIRHSYRHQICVEKTDDNVQVY